MIKLKVIKFLEFIESHFPNKLYKYFSKSLFVYANVPYRIKSYEEILKDSKNTIDYDHESESTINKRRSEIGVDGSLLYNNNSDIHRVNFIEKILATLLSKVSNFVPEGGIWMNTQRPEWNDANNALVGNGISMVTLYYLRRFVNFFKSVLEKTDYISVEVSTEINKFFNEIYSALNENKGLLESSISDSDRKKIVDLLGHAGSNYRNTIYDNSFSGFDNIGNNREISNAINSDMITNFESRFVKKPVNQLETDIDITGESVKKNITGVNMSNNDTSYQL